MFIWQSLLDLFLIEKVHFINKSRNRTISDIHISVLKNMLMRVIHITIILYFHVQIEICCNEIDSDNIIHIYIQAKTDKAVKWRNIFFTQSLMLPNIFRMLAIQSGMLLCRVPTRNSAPIPSSTQNRNSTRVGAFMAHHDTIFSEVYQWKFIMQMCTECQNKLI